MYSSHVIHGQTTPPSYTQPAFYPDSVESHFSHASYQYQSSIGNSPADSVITSNSSPQRSPRATIKSNGPPLLPRIRCQDQTTEPIATAGPVGPVGPIGHIGHVRSVSLAAPGIHTSFAVPGRFHRRGTSPLDSIDLQSPASVCSLPASAYSNLSSASAYTASTTPSSAITHLGTPSPCVVSAHSTGLNSPVTIQPPQGSRRSSLAHVRNISAPAIHNNSHSRSASSSSIDESAILKHGYPTQYRQIPQYITSAPVVPSSMAPVLSIPDGFTMQQLDPSPINTPVDMTLSLATDFGFAPYPQINLLSYLTAPGPQPRLVVRSIGDQRNRDFGWWDVRNLRNWSDFTLDNIFSIQQFPSLLQVPLNLNGLPNSPPGNPAPETEYALRDVIRDQLATKVNAALEITQGAHHLSMRAVNSATVQPCPKPDFISTYPNDFLKTLRGEERGHLVGIVKAFDEWNTGMRTEDAPRKVKYLQGLAQLHRIMREHGCRYGFIITEIELLCVRVGAEDEDYTPTFRQYNANSSTINGVSDDGPKPIFGLLETSAPIPLSATGIDAKSGGHHLTAAMALWFLHMLAKDEPLPGYPPWKIAVGGPVAVTRQHHEARDSWMPKVAQHESRVAKRVRGWVWPNEPFSRKEAHNLRRNRAGH
jgi:hypothetical protein